MNFYFLSVNVNCMLNHCLMSCTSVEANVMKKLMMSWRGSWCRVQVHDVVKKPTMSCWSSCHEESYLGSITIRDALRPQVSQLCCSCKFQNFFTFFLNSSCRKYLVFIHFAGQNSPNSQSLHIANINTRHSIARQITCYCVACYMRAFMPSPFSDIPIFAV